MSVWKFKPHVRYRDHLIIKYWKKNPTSRPICQKLRAVLDPLLSYTPSVSLSSAPLFLSALTLTEALPRSLSLSLSPSPLPQSLSVCPSLSQPMCARLILSPISVSLSYPPPQPLAFCVSASTPSAALSPSSSPIPTPSSVSRRLWVCDEQGLD